MMNAINMALEKQIDIDESNRLETFKRRAEYYQGKFEKPLKVKDGERDDNLRVNFARLFVDKGVSFLFGKELRFDIVEGKDTAEEKYLNRVWNANGKMSLLQKLATSGAIYGTAFLKIHREPGRDPKLVVIDPETLTVKLNADDVDDVWAYIIAYPSVEKDGKRAVQIRQVIERDGAGWKITDERGSDGFWRVVNSLAWPYPFSPVVHCQNMIAPNDFWGVSDIEDDIIELIDKYNFTFSNILRVLRYHGHPLTWVAGASKKDLEEFLANPDTTLVLPVGATVNNLEMRADLSATLETLRRLKEGIHELARVPEVAVGKVESVGQLSGIALEILYQPLLEKTSAKRVTYGELIVETCRRLLALNGYGYEHYVSLHWQSLLPKDESIVANAALVKQQIGVSRNTLLKELGYDADKEIARVKSEGENSPGGEMLKSFDRGFGDIE